MAVGSRGKCGYVVIFCLYLMNMALTKQEEDFCEQYAANGGNAVAAAISVGYDDDDIEKTAKALLLRDDIKAEIKLWEPPKVIDPPAYWKLVEEFGDKD
jgi:hypothetical protein